MGTGTDAFLDLTFAMSYTSNDAGGNFYSRFMVGNATPTVAAIPEPSTWAMLAFGLLGVVMVTRRRRLVMG